jgi:hypothetical protein
MKKQKTNCYECRWRIDCDGSSHSKCCHPANKGVADDPMVELMSIFASVGRVRLLPLTPKELNIKANQHGIDGGWFHYPNNFDPVWLDSCDGFAATYPDDPRQINKCKIVGKCEDCDKRYECFTERK